MGDPVDILPGLPKCDDILQAADHVVSPNAGVLVGKFLRRKTHGQPDLRLVEVSGLQRKLKTARHHADDRVGLAVENDETVEDVRIPVVAVLPQGITDRGKRLVRILFPLRKRSAQDGLHAQGWEDTSSEAGGVNFFRKGAPGKLVVGGDVAAQRGKGAGCIRISADLTGRNGKVRIVPQMISEQNEAFRVAEWEWTQQDAFDQRKDRRRSSDAESQSENDGQSEARCFPQLANCEAEILRERVHTYSMTPDSQIW